MPTSLDRMIGLRLRDVREQRGVTQRELAFALHVSPVQIRDWEKGRTTLTAARIEQLARTLHVQPKALREMPGEAVRRIECE